ncbi:hypothetical protein KL942_003718 [Ogataea angusta]|nr:hypothetical protein KL909_002876 [Ogataea angusta]KAG7839356.1 hypothetical protein KL942_003718 [Ogataea angusta]
MTNTCIHRDAATAKFFGPMPCATSRAGRPEHSLNGPWPGFVPHIVNRTSLGTCPKYGRVALNLEIC